MRNQGLNVASLRSGDVILVPRSHLHLAVGRGLVLRHIGKRTISVIFPDGVVRIVRGYVDLLIRDKKC